MDIILKWYKKTEKRNEHSTSKHRNGKEKRTREQKVSRFKNYLHNWNPDHSAACTLACFMHIILSSRLSFGFSWHLYFMHKMCLLTLQTKWLCEARYWNPVIICVLFFNTVLMAHRSDIRKILNNEHPIDASPPKNLNWAWKSRVSRYDFPYSV